MTRDFSDRQAGTSPDVSGPELEALQWVVRMTSGDAGPAEQSAFAEWCGRAAGNRAALASAYRLWLATGPALRATGRSPARQQRWPLLALAASLLLLISLGYGGYTAWLAAPVPGKTAIAQLDDAGGYCRLSLGGGAASFDVTPTPGFTAEAAGETHVRVMDAAFSLKPSASGVLVTVIDGRVEYNDSKGLHVFSAGQQMSCNATHRTAADRTPSRKTPGLLDHGVGALWAVVSDTLAGNRMRDWWRRKAFAVT